MNFDSIKKGKIPEFNLNDINITSVMKLLSRSEIHVDSVIYIRYLELFVHICVTNNRYPPTTLLCAAVLKKDHELIDYLLSQNADINLVIGQMNALQIAVKRHDEKTFKKLYHLGADIHCKISPHDSPFMDLLKLDGCYDLVKYLIERGEDIIANDSTLHQLVIACQYQRDIRVVKLLLDNSTLSQSVLNSALKSCTDRGIWKIAQLLVERGADVNYTNDRDSKDSLLTEQYDNEPIMYNVLTLAWNDNFLAYLLTLDEPMTDINVLTVRKRNLLHSGLSDGHELVDFCNFFLDAGIDINAKDSDGKLAIEYSNTRDQYSSWISIIKRHIVKLIAAGLPVCEKNRQAVENNFQDIKNMCLKEIQKMKINKISASNIFFFDVFPMSFHYLAVRLKFAGLDQVIDKEKLRSEYPEYGRMLFYKLSKVERRIKYLQVLETSVGETLHKWGLPLIFIRELWYYFTNIELKQLVKALNKKNDSVNC